jgi:hypothetical protein
VLGWQTFPSKAGLVWQGDGEGLEPVTRGGDPQSLPEVKLV